MKDNKAALVLAVTLPNGDSMRFRITDIDKDGRPEVHALVDMFGIDLAMGPIESPIAFPDLAGLPGQLVNAFIAGKVSL